MPIESRTKSCIYNRVEFTAFKITIYELEDKEAMGILHIGTKWVSDGLSDKFHGWSHHNPVLISAQTGRGKNHFIMSEIIPYALQNGQQVFLFSNRVALNVQQKRELLKTLSIPNIYSDEELHQISNFGPVTILDYQSALKFLSAYGTNYPIGGFPFSGRSGWGYAIFDEAHFFVSDALFNSRTESIFQKLVYAFSYYTRIYLTATPENIIPVIDHYERTNQERRRLTYYELYKLCPGERDYNSSKDDVLNIFEFPRDYSDYNVNFFGDFSEIYSIMNQNKPNKEKWLFFVNSLERQEVLAKELSEKTKKKIDRFDSSKKNNTPVWKKLIDGTIPNDVLLTTSALDNGLNITDPLLHNIVIEFTDRISFLQILGRKRVRDGEKINVFVQVPSVKMVAKRYRNIHDMLFFVGKYQEDSKHFLQQNWSEFEKKYRNLFWIDDEEKLTFNRFSGLELNYLWNFYGNILFQMQQQTDPNVQRNIYPRQVLTWMNLSQEILWVAEAEVKGDRKSVV